MVRVLEQDDVHALSASSVNRTWSDDNARFAECAPESAEPLAGNPCKCESAVLTRWPERHAMDVAKAHLVGLLALELDAHVAGHRCRGEVAWRDVTEETSMAQVARCVPDSGPRSLRGHTRALTKAEQAVVH